MRNPNFSSQL